MALFNQDWDSIGGADDETQDDNQQGRPWYYSSWNRKNKNTSDFNHIYILYKSAQLSAERIIQLETLSNEDTFKKITMIYLVQHNRKIIH
ncbi:unnamed protein product [Adineta steineri]|uniref:Uncharacterized protein n=1 Tax=Adineta steineri TaxID=433720 RepID=A0A816DIR5_9BILA|nr:unnamed protein product [Adineta steineri]CAF1635298.1 unnamed protein product [Adineta steineri]